MSPVVYERRQAIHAAISSILSPSPIGVFKADIALNVYVTNTLGKIVYEKKEEEGAFAYTATGDGQYGFCLGNTDASEVDVKMTFDAGLHKADDDKAHAPKKAALKPAEEAAKRMEMYFAQIKTNEEFIRGRQARMREFAETSASQMTWFSVASIMVVIGVAFLQFWYLDSFFKSKGLIR